MLLALQVRLLLNLKGLDLYSKTWREFVSGQIATAIGFLHSKKCLIGGFSSSGIFFWFPLSTALSVLFPFNDQQRVRDASFFCDTGAASLVHLYNALLTQHSVKFFERSSSGS